MLGYKCLYHFPQHISALLEHLHLNGDSIDEINYWQKRKWRRTQCVQLLSVQQKWQKIWRSQSRRNRTELAKKRTQESCVRKKIYENRALKNAPRRRSFNDFMIPSFNRHFNTSVVAIISKGMYSLLLLLLSIVLYKLA